MSGSAKALQVHMPLLFISLVALLAQTHIVKSEDAEQVRNLAIRKIVNSEIQPEFEVAIKSAEKRAQEKHRPFEEKEKDALKYLFYNKAYIYFECAEQVLPREHIHPNDENIKRLLAQRAKCAKSKLAAFLVTMKIIDDYGVYSFNSAATAKCEMKSRLFKAEIEFPPFDFLASKNLQLLDAEKYNTCILADR